MADGMDFNSPVLLRLAKSAAETSKAESQHAIISTVFSVAALEAFLNELSGLFAQGALAAGHERFARCEPVLRELDERKESLLMKISVLHAIVGERPFDKGSPPWQDLVALIAVRNAIIHRRPTMLFLDASAPYGARLEQKKVPQRLKERCGIDCNQPWSAVIRSSAVATWSVQTAADCISELVRMLPLKSRPSHAMRFMFRDLIPGIAEESTEQSGGR